MNNVQGQAARKAHKAQHCWPSSIYGTKMIPPPSDKAPQTPSRLLSPTKNEV